MTRTPIETEKQQFQPVTAYLYPSSSTERNKPKYALSLSDAIPDDFLSISVLSKPSPHRTDYIIPRFHIDNIILSKCCFFYLNGFKELALKAIYLDINCRTYLMETGK